nr:hypothetical protein [Tanacetum cinerariifolium]
MSTQQDIYAAGSKNRNPMLNMENYIPWSSHLLWYAKSRPNGKLIYNSIINGPYVRRMIPEPGDLNHKVLVNETFHVQTDDELTKKELKQLEADNQAIQTILLGLPEDIYAVIDSYETAQEIWLRVHQMMKGSDIEIQEKKAKQIAQPGMNMGQDRQMQMVGGNGGNQFRQYVGQNVGNLNGYNDVQNVRNQVIHNAVQSNPNGNGNLIAARVEVNVTGHDGNQIRCYNCRGVAAAADLDEIEEVNANCILMANLEQASTSGTQTDKAPVCDSDGSAEVHNYEDCCDNEIFNMFTQEEQYTELLEPIPEPHQVPQNDNNVISEVSSVEQSEGTVEQHPANVEEMHLNKQLSKEKSTVSFLLEEKKRLKSDFKIREDEILDKQIQHEKMIKELDNILVKTGQSIQTIHMLSPKPDSFYHTEQKIALEAAKFVGDFKSLAQEADESLGKHKALELEIERLLRAVVSQDIMSVDTTRGTSATTKFVKQSILGKPPKVGETHALSKPVTSKSIPTPQGSKVMKNVKMIAPGMCRINPFKPSREEKHVPNKVRASVRTNPITISQPPVITKKVVNSDSNGLSSTGLDNTAKTRRPQPRSNTIMIGSLLCLRVVAERIKKLK